MTPEGHQQRGTPEAGDIGVTPAETEVYEECWGRKEKVNIFSCSHSSEGYRVMRKKESSLNGGVGWGLLMKNNIR